MIRATQRVLLITLLVAAVPAFGQVGGTIAKDMQLGGQKVGFQVIQTYDGSRSSLSSIPGRQAPDRGRPMQVYIWYPARDSNGKRLTISDYVRLRASEIVFEPNKARADAEEKRFVAASVEHGMSEKDAVLLLTHKSAAHQNVAVAPGKWPILLFSHASPESENVMAEYLASFGYIVAGVSSKGTWQSEYKLSHADVSTMTTDLGFVLATVRRLAYADESRIGAIGMSNGAFAALLLHSRNADIRAVVSLDGTIGEKIATKVFSQDPFFNGASPTATILHLYSPDNPYLDLKPLENLNRADRYLVTFAKMKHWEFLSHAAYAKDVGGNRKGFLAVCELTRSFFDHAFGPQSRDPWEPMSYPKEIVTNHVHWSPTAVQ